MLGYHPREGEVLKCDFSGFQVPEMVKARWVVVISPKYLSRGRLASGKREYVSVILTKEEVWHIKMCLLKSLGLTALTAATPAP